MTFLVTDPEALWLNLTNAGLGIVVLICVVVFVVAIISEFSGRARRRAHVIATADAELRELLGVADRR